MGQVGWYTKGLSFRTRQRGVGEEDVKVGLGGEEGGRLQLGCKVINY